jgi:plasmid stabilization system protein ParE
MSYTVLYRPRAENDLAAIWVAATDRAAVTRAADTIDALLRTTPLRLGESRPGATRILIVPPLGVHYEVVEDDKTVFVLHLWLIRRPSS